MRYWPFYLLGKHDRYDPASLSSAFVLVQSRLQLSNFHFEHYNIVYDVSRKWLLTNILYNAHRKVYFASSNVKTFCAAN